LQDEFRTRRRFGVNFYKINNLAPPERKVPPELLSGAGLGQAQYLDVLLEYVACSDVTAAFMVIHNAWRLFFDFGCAGVLRS
jgi:hypothetical protein